MAISSDKFSVIVRKSQKGFELGSVVGNCPGLNFVDASLLHDNPLARNQTAKILDFLFKKKALLGFKFQPGFSDVLEDFLDSVDVFFDSSGRD